MRAKRLKHCAHVLCHMFCGWRLHSDWDTLVQLGSGVLTIDVLSEECLHDDTPIPPLNIARNLREWLVKDLSFYHIPLAELIEAILEVEFELGKPEPNPSGPEVPCRFSCRSQISTDEMVYKSTYEDQYSLIVHPDSLPLERQERDRLVQECFRMVEGRRLTR